MLSVGGFTRSVRLRIPCEVLGDSIDEMPDVRLRSNRVTA